MLACSSVVENCQFKLAKVLWVGKHIDCDNLPTSNREAEDDTQSPARSPHKSNGPVYERQFCCPGSPRELPGHGQRTANLLQSAHMHGCLIGSKHSIWVEHRKKGVEVTTARGSEEGVDYFSLAGEIDVGISGRSLHPPTCAARKLPCRGRGAPHDGCNLVERYGEEVVQHERETLGGIQGVEYHEQCETDRVGQQSFVFGIDSLLAAHDWV